MGARPKQHGSDGKKSRLDGLIEGALRALGVRTLSVMGRRKHVRSFVRQCLDGGIVYDEIGPDGEVIGEKEGAFVGIEEDGEGGLWILIKHFRSGAVGVLDEVTGETAFSPESLSASNDMTEAIQLPGAEDEEHVREIRITEERIRPSQITAIRSRK